MSGGERARFHSWHLVGAAPGREHVIDTFGAVSVAFRLDVAEHIPRARHGIALLSQTGQNLWGTAVVDLDLRPGTYDLTHQVPSLMFQPGPYYWQVSVYTDSGLIDLWDCLPEVVIATDPVTHYRDEYAGILNMPSTFECVDLRQSRAAS